MMATIGIARIEIIPAPGGTLQPLSVPEGPEVKQYIAVKSGHNAAKCQNLNGNLAFAPSVADWIGRSPGDKPVFMARYDFRTSRLFVDTPIAEGAALALG